MASSSGFLKRFLLGFLLLLLLLPALQAKFHVVSVKPLGGYTESAPHPTLSQESLLDNSYQVALEKYIDERLGFREWLIRLYNQWAYSLLNQIRLSTVDIGHDQQLYQYVSINAYLGRDFLGEDEINFRLQRLRRVQDTLRAHGTRLLVVLAPGKARILPEFLPTSFAAVQPTPPSNQTVVARMLREKGIEMLDASALMLRWKDTASYPLFPRTGTHWSGYAVALLGDTLFRRAASMAGLPVPTIRRHKGTVATHINELHYTDNDLGELINLSLDIPPYPMYYPKLEMAAPAGKKPNMLIIGDSFAQSLYSFYPFYQQLLDPRSRYWSYNQQIFWPDNTPESHTVHELNLREQYMGRQLIVLLGTEQNLPQLGFGFIDDAFDIYFPRTAKDSLRTQELEKQILASPEWVDRIAKEAAENGRDVTQAVHDNAQYMADRER